MSIAKYAVGEGSAGQSEAQTVKPKGTPRRQYVALADIKAVPEPR